MNKKSKELTVKQYADLIGKTKKTVWFQIDEGRLPVGVSSRRIGGIGNGSVLIIEIDKKSELFKQL